MDLRLCGKVALVTDSSRGIRLATAKAFAAEGCRMMLSARRRSHYGRPQRLCARPAPKLRLTRPMSAVPMAQPA
jgi:NAD(P)-dependent dehydrogenase (short-subunit alcohol dehydrogenase family)